jgi:hypothetical protein
VVGKLARAGTGVEIRGAHGPGPLEIHENR